MGLVTRREIRTINRKYEDILANFKDSTDDRALAFNMYQIVLETINSLNDSANVHIRVAVTKAINNDLRKIDAIIHRFTGKVYAADQWVYPEDVPRVQAEYREEFKKRYGHLPIDTDFTSPSVTCFAVTSYRHYGSDESYYGFDGLFPTEDAAAEYIRKDIDDTVNEAGPIDDPSIDYDDFHAEIDGNVYDWQIEPVQLSADIVEMCFTAFHDAL